MREKSFKWQNTSEDKQANNCITSSEMTWSGILIINTPQNLLTTFTLLLQRIKSPTYQTQRCESPFKSIQKLINRKLNSSCFFTRHKYGTYFNMRNIKIQNATTNLYITFYPTNSQTILYLKCKRTNVRSKAKALVTVWRSSRVD